MRSVTASVAGQISWQSGGGVAHHNKGLWADRRATAQLLSIIQAPTSVDLRRRPILGNAKSLLYCLSRRNASCKPGLLLVLFDYFPSAVGLYVLMIKLGL